MRGRGARERSTVMAGAGAGARAGAGVLLKRNTALAFPRSSPPTPLGILPSLSVRPPLLSPMISV